MTERILVFAKPPNVGAGMTHKETHGQRSICHSCQPGTMTKRNPTTGAPRKRMSVGQAQRARTLSNVRRSSTVSKRR